METILFEDFRKIDIRIGKILTAERVEGSDKLLKLEVDFGPKEAEDPSASSGPDIRQVIAGIAQFYAPEALIGKECPFAYNLAPRVLKGLESQGMILCPSDANGPVLMHPNKEIEPGSIVE